MTSDTAHDAWSAGQSYEHYMGRWSRKIASEFLAWLQPETEMDWLEIGCGTGALTSAVLSHSAPRSILATDASADFVGHAETTLDDPRVTFRTADAQALPLDDASVDAIASALVLNFVPDKPAALREMQRVLRPQGLLSFYVWDYPGGGMGFIDAFWRAAAEVDPKAAELDEGRRFPFCTQAGLKDLCKGAGLTGAEVTGVEVVTEFPDFPAFWQPFTMGAGPAPGYCASLSPEHRDAVKSRLEQALGLNGPIRLPARAWAAKMTA